MSTLRPAIVFPYHDPDGNQFPIVESITPALQDIFDCAFLAVSHITATQQARLVDHLQADTFFHLTFTPPDALIGDKFVAVYRQAAMTCSPDQILHLCFHDRVAFALQSNHRAAFIADIQAIDTHHAPLLFQRSSAAWQTHPRNYFETEQMATHTGEMLFGKALDWAWCHLALTAQQLRDALPHVHRHDLVVLAEILFPLRQRITTQDVDWLAWEDPHILKRDAEELRHERENSLTEHRKRLSYVLPTMQFLFEQNK